MDLLSTALSHQPTLFYVGLAITAVALAVVLVAEVVARPSLNAIFKPIASFGFLLAGFAHPGAFASGYGVMVIIALVLGAAGDVLLIPKSNGPIFRAGILSFLLAHVAYLVAFFFRGIDAVSAAVALAVLVAPAYLVWRYLAGRVDASLRGAVVSYITVITLMVALSIGVARFTEPAAPMVAVAAIVFYLSDLTVARQRFVVKRFWHRGLGLPLYFGAQFLFITTL